MFRVLGPSFYVDNHDNDVDHDDDDGDDDVNDDGDNAKYANHLVEIMIMMVTTMMTVTITPNMPTTTWWWGREVGRPHVTVRGWTCRDICFCTFVHCDFFANPKNKT